MSGVNICGFIRGNVGIGQSARNCAMALQAAGIPFCCVPFPGRRSENTDESWSHTIRRDNHNPFDVNLIHFTPMLVQLFMNEMGAEFFKGKVNIGYWHWEMPRIPESWIPYVNQFDAIWCPTRFVANAVKKTVPNARVSIISHAIELPPVNRSWSRSGEGFTFLCTFDGSSSKQRKNPEATIEAFKLAFGTRYDARLIVKTQNITRDDEADLRALAGTASIVIVNENYTRERLIALLHSCDAFVSLHRAEGFGLCLAECMSLGKPCIATNYSGNLEFMTQENSCLVAAPLVSFDETHDACYPEGGQWADPSVDEAARYMRALVDDGEMCARLGFEARFDISRYHNPRVIGAKYTEALRSL